MNKLAVVAVLFTSLSAFAIPVPTCTPDNTDCNIDNILQCGGAPKCAITPSINLFDVTATSQFVKAHGK